MEIIADIAVFGIIILLARKPVIALSRWIEQILEGVPQELQSDLEEKKKGEKK